MKRHSCGAILYTIYCNKIYIILGMERGMWFPFKGTKEKGENYENTAIREIKEETCNTVIVDNIELNCKFSTKRKYYHIGLVRVSPDIIDKFYINRNKILSKKNITDADYAYLEKTAIQMFSLDDIFNNYLHSISLRSIKYYYTFLNSLQKKIKNNNMAVIKKSILDNICHTNISYNII